MTSVIDLMTGVTRIVVQRTWVGDPRHSCRLGIMDILGADFICIARRIVMISTSETKTPSTKQLISPVLACICLTLMLLLHWLFPVRMLLHFPFDLAGLLLGGLGLTICFLAHRQFKIIGTTLYPFNQPEKLVTDGLFRHTRNPMYLGLTIFLGGAWLFFGSLTPGVFVVAFLLVADRWYIPYEEQQLLAAFGGTYKAYQSKTPRWI
jgi:protein-S-isoprenylcysteine O-methyltransferase Ste14